jgi:ubiquinone/menaquinone biosynthesis C-methylase UbiE
MRHEHSGHSTMKYVDIPKVISLLVDEKAVFLDIGCGPGDYLKEARKRTENAIGIDTHAPSIAVVNSMGILGIVADATKNIPLENDSVDSVLIANVLHGFIANNEDASALKEVVRVLKKGGLLGIVEFKKDAKAGPPREIKLSPEDVVTRLAAEGFSKVSEQDVGLYHYMVVFRKN